MNLNVFIAGVLSLTWGFFGGVTWERNRNEKDAEYTKARLAEIEVRHRKERTTRFVGHRQGSNMGISVIVGPREVTTLAAEIASWSGT